jgi:hypothetical protein
VATITIHARSDIPATNITTIRPALQPTQLRPYPKPLAMAPAPGRAVTWSHIVLRLFNQLVAKQVQGTPNSAVQHAEPGLEARHPQPDGVGFRRPRQSVEGGRVMHSNCLRAPAISLICRAGLRSLAAEPGRAGSHVLERT